MNHAPHHRHPLGKLRSPAPGSKRQALRLLGAAFAGLLGGLSSPAHATVTLTANSALSEYTFFGIIGTHTRRLTMRVGSQYFGTISNVSFDVTGANVAPSPAPVPGIPSSGAAPGSAPANSVRISVSNRWTDFAGQRVIVTVDTSAGLACTTSVSCGSTVIPFSKISWTSSGLATGGYAGQDFGSGSFSGSTNQTLLDFTAPAARSFSIVNDWNFTYSNDTLYPAGVYQGRATFTATMP
jgi:hypothetical protein